MIAVGFDLATLQKGYANVTQAGTITCDYCMTYEDDLPVYAATNPTVSLADVWPALKDFS